MNIGEIHLYLEDSVALASSTPIKLETIMVNLCHLLFI